MYNIKSMSDFEFRYEEIKTRMLEIEKEMQDDPYKIEDLAEEILMLMQESRFLSYDIYKFKMMAEQLLDANCSGPH